MIPIETPAFLELDIAGSPTLNVTASYNRHDKRYVVNSLTMAHPFVPITGKVLRTLPLRSLMIPAMRTALGDANKELMGTPALKTFFKGTAGRAASAKNAHEPSLAVLEQAAAIHHLAQLTGDFPVRSIQRCFSLEYRDAKRWAGRLRTCGWVA